jgi:hypothetical protein
LEQPVNTLVASRTSTLENPMFFALGAATRYNHHHHYYYYYYYELNECLYILYFIVLRLLVNNMFMD